MTVTFPGGIWDGDSLNRNSDNAPMKAPDYRDWSRLIDELAATQNALKGVDPNVLHTIGALTSKTGLSVVETGTGAVHKSVITFASMAMVSTDGTTPATDGAWGTQPLYTFPVGHVAILGAHLVFPLGLIIATTGGGTGFSDTADIGIGVGSVAAANSTEWGISTTEEDVCAELDVDLTAATSDAIESNAQATVAVHDGSAGAIDIHLNFRGLADDDHGTVADILTVSGTLTLLWTMLGDN